VVENPEDVPLERGEVGEPNVAVVLLVDQPTVGLQLRTVFAGGESVTRIDAVGRRTTGGAPAVVRTIR
jgi:hypothetical protein